MKMINPKNDTMNNMLSLIQEGLSGINLFPNRDQEKSNIMVEPVESPNNLRLSSINSEHNLLLDDELSDDLIDINSLDDLESDEHKSSDDSNDSGWNSDEEISRQHTKPRTTYKTAKSKGSARVSSNPKLGSRIRLGRNEDHLGSTEDKPSLSRDRTFIDDNMSEEYDISLDNGKDEIEQEDTGKSGNEQYSLDTPYTSYRTRIPRNEQRKYSSIPSTSKQSIQTSPNTFNQSRSFKTKMKHNEPKHSSANSYKFRHKLINKLNILKQSHPEFVSEDYSSFNLKSLQNYVDDIRLNIYMAEDVSKNLSYIVLGYMAIELFGVCYLKMDIFDGFFKFNAGKLKSMRFSLLEMAEKSFDGASKNSNPMWMILFTSVFNVVIFFVISVVNKMYGSDISPTIEKVIDGLINSKSDKTVDMMSGFMNMVSKFM